jgi:hypothetical protein
MREARAGGIAGPRADQLSLGLIDGCDRVSEASASRGATATHPRRRRTRLAVRGGSIGRKHQDRCVQRQYPPSQQTGDDGCLDPDSLRKTVHANRRSGEARPLDPGRRPLGNVHGLRGRIAFPPGASPSHHEPLDDSRRSRTDETPALAAVSNAKPATVYTARRIRVWRGPLPTSASSVSMRAPTSR